MGIANIEHFNTESELVGEFNATVAVTYAMFGIFLYDWGLCFFRFDLPLFMGRIKFKWPLLLYFLNRLVASLFLAFTIIANAAYMVQTGELTHMSCDRLVQAVLAFAVIQATLSSLVLALRCMALYELRWQVVTVLSIMMLIQFGFAVPVIATVPWDTSYPLGAGACGQALVVSDSSHLYCAINYAWTAIVDVTVLALTVRKLTGRSGRLGQPIEKSSSQTSLISRATSFWKVDTAQTNDPSAKKSIIQLLLEQGVGAVALTLLFNLPVMILEFIHLNGQAVFIPYNIGVPANAIISCHIIIALHLHNQPAALTLLSGGRQTNTALSASSGYISSAHKQSFHDMDSTGKNVINVHSDKTEDLRTICELRFARSSRRSSGNEKFHHRETNLMTTDLTSSCVEEHKSQSVLQVQGFAWEDEDLIIYSSPASGPGNASQSVTSAPSGNLNAKQDEAAKKVSTIARWRAATVQLLKADEQSSSNGKVSNVGVRRLFELAKPEKKTLTVASGMLLASSAVSLSIPLTFGKMIDYFSSTDPASVIPIPISIAAAGIVGVFLVGAICSVGRTILFRIAGQRVIQRVRSAAYSNALKQDIAWHDRKEGGVGDTVSRLTTDAAIVGNSVTNNLSDGLRSVVMSVAGVGAMFWISSQLTLLMLSIVPPISIGAVLYGRYLKILSKRTQEALGDVSRISQEKLSAIRTVAASNAQATEAALFDTKIDTVYELSRKEAVASGAFFGITGFAGNLTVLALLGYGGHLVSLGEISVGNLSSLLIYTVYVGSALSNLTSFFSSFMKGVGAAERVFELTDAQPTIVLGQGAEITSTRGQITFRGVNFTYPSRPNTQILSNINFVLNEGQSTALCGGSGSGKSSIQQLLLRYYNPSAGTITLNGQDISNFKPESWRKIIGVVPQDPVMFQASVADNIAYGHPEASKDDIKHAAKMANCDFINYLPEGFQTQIGLSSLSGGQTQRLSIARALLGKPSILLFDEATSALDAGSELLVNDAIDKIIADGKTTVMIIAHRLSTIARAQNVALLENGTIAETGTYAQLSQNPKSRFRALMASQLGPSPLPPVETTNDSVS